MCSRESPVIPSTGRRARELARGRGVPVVQDRDGISPAFADFDRTYRYACKIALTYGYGLHHDDAISAAGWAYVRARDLHDGSAEFKTYLILRVRGAVMNAMNFKRSRGVVYRGRPASGPRRKGVPFNLNLVRSRSANLSDQLDCAEILSRLPERDAKLLWMRAQDYTYQEMADEFDTWPANIRKEYLAALERARNATANHE